MVTNKMKTHTRCGLVFWFRGQLSLQTDEGREASDGDFVNMHVSETKKYEKNTQTRNLAIQIGHVAGGDLG